MSQQQWDPYNDPTIPSISADSAIAELAHCHAPLIMEFPSTLRQIEKAGSLNYEEDESLYPHSSEGIRIANFEYAEHLHLGDSLKLGWHDETSSLAKDRVITLENGLNLTYGQINALGGDFFGSNEPICNADGLEEQIKRFEEGYATLAIDPAGVQDAQKLVKLKDDEVQLFNKAAAEGKSPSSVYLNEVHSTRDNLIAALQGIFGRKEKGYLGLALINFDHFGEDARKAYNAGHTAALRKAASSKEPRTLEIAYAMNGFADHFLEDSFASGHLRVPRQILHGSVNVAADICGMVSKTNAPNSQNPTNPRQYMHDEDNALGLEVENLLGETWKMYGDKKLLNFENQANLAKCHSALMASTQEVFAAWSTGTVPPLGTYAAWTHAPVLSSAFSEKNHAPLFNDKGYPRDRIEDRQCREYKGKWGFWSYPSLALQLKFSDAFKEPIGG